MDESILVGGCCVCSEDDGTDDNKLVYCDGLGCSVAVHQLCYGIVEVPEGDWHCTPCSRNTNPSTLHCELCPKLGGALKPTDTGGWAHVLCALFIPEVAFGNQFAMEPILTLNMKKERYGKKCSICNDSSGACVQCSFQPPSGRPSCKQVFHATCGQRLGLLCEMAGNSSIRGDGGTNYAAFCTEHVGKPGSKVKRLPAFKSPERLSAQPGGDAAPAMPRTGSTSSPKGRQPKDKPAKKSAKNSLSSPTSAAVVGLGVVGKSESYSSESVVNVSTLCAESLGLNGAKLDPLAVCGTLPTKHDSEYPFSELLRGIYETARVYIVDEVQSSASEDTVEMLRSICEVEADNDRLEEQLSSLTAQVAALRQLKSQLTIHQQAQGQPQFLQQLSFMPLKLLDSTPQCSRSSNFIEEINGKSSTPQVTLDGSVVMQPPPPLGP